MGNVWGRRCAGQGSPSLHRVGLIRYGIRPIASHQAVPEQMSHEYIPGTVFVATDHLASLLVRVCPKADPDPDPDLDPDPDADPE